MSFKLLRQFLLLLACLCTFAPGAGAQSPDEDPVETARVQIGPLGLTPAISLSNLGIDSNVFNTFEDPKKDFTFTVSPQVDLFFRAGPSQLAVNSRADLVYFREYAGERSLDGDVDGRWEIRWNRLTPWVAAGYSSGRQRVGYEIDARSRREIKDYAAGVETRVAAKTRIAVSAQRTLYFYDADALFFGTSLREVLNHETESIGLQYRQSFTPLTTFVVHGETMRDTFDFSPVRDSKSVRVQAGFDLDERALIFGRGRVGYRRFESVGGGLPDFSGIVASYGVGTTIKGRTRLEVAGERDINYSYELAYPYYVLSGATVTATPRLTDKWDIQGRAGQQWLAYRAAEGMTTAANRTDTSRLFGGGIGFHLGREIRIGFNIDRQQRMSPLQSRDYDGYRYGTSITYGR
jgi:opacity protein-like surface antigen